MIEKFDIYYTRFYYDDRVGSKKRPTLVIDVVDDIVVCAKITSKEKRFGSDYEVRDWKESGLKEPSVIRFGDLQPVDVKYIGEKWGHLTEYDIDVITSTPFI